MGYSQEVLRRARARLDQEREARQSRYAQRLEQAYEHLPRLKQIDMELRRSMALAAQTVFTTGGDAKAVMEQVRMANQALQNERRELVEANFPVDHLDESPLCPLCGDRGYVGSRMCACLQELCRQEQVKELTLLAGGGEDFEKFRLDYYGAMVDPHIGASPRKVMEVTFRTCKKYAEEFTTASGNLLFSGGTGLGKTFLSSCIARSVSRKGYSVVYETAGRLFSVMNRVQFEGDEDARREAKRYTACDLLILDDLGTEMGGQFTTAALYTLINDRLLLKKPTVISTNLTSADIEKRYSVQVASRLRGEYTRVAFVGEDIRVKKNQMF